MYRTDDRSGPRPGAPAYDIFAFWGFFNRNTATSVVIVQVFARISCLGAPCDQFRGALSSWQASLRLHVEPPATKLSWLLDQGRVRIATAISIAERHLRR